MDRTTTGLRAIQKQQDLFEVKSLASVTVAGPMMAGISWALAIYMSLPTGYGLMLSAVVIAFVVVAANSERRRRTELVGYFALSVLILFWHGAMASTAGGELISAAAPSESEEVSWLIPDAMAGEPVEHYAVSKWAGVYDVRRGESQWRVPVEVYDAIRQYERSQRKGFGVRW